MFYVHILVPIPEMLFCRSAHYDVPDRQLQRLQAEITPTRAGLCASVSLLIEKKSRRAELALYTMPRAADSLLLALTQRRWVPSLRFGALCGPLGVGL